MLVGHPSQWQNLALAGNDSLAQGRVGKNSVSVMVDHFWVVTDCSAQAMHRLSKTVPYHIGASNMTCQYDIARVSWMLFVIEQPSWYSSVVSCLVIGNAVRHCTRLSACWLCCLCWCCVGFCLLREWCSICTVGIVNYASCRVLYKVFWKWFMCLLLPSLPV